MHADPDFWDGVAEGYAAKPIDDPAAFERKIAFNRSLLSPTDTVLEVGCGTGSLALILGPEVHQWVGLDLSPEMNRIAKEKAAAQGVDNVSFHVGPFDESFDLVEEGSVDCVCAYSILHLLPDRAACIARMHRLLKPGGVLVASTVCLGRQWYLFTPMLTAMRWVGKAPWVSVLRAETVMGEMREAGFVDVEEVDVGSKSKLVSFTVARKPG